MPNLIALYRPDNSVIGRCNQHCYNATDKSRPCICGGINNGVGLAKAKANLPKVVAHIARHPTTPGPHHIKVFPAAAQQRLFSEAQHGLPCPSTHSAIPVYPHSFHCNCPDCTAQRS